MGNGKVQRWTALLGVLAALASVAVARADDVNADEAERQAVEAWVRADIERALRFLESGPNVALHLVSVRQVPATSDQSAERIQRLAAVKKVIEGKPDHPMREEHDRLLVFAPGASLLANGDVWLGTMKGQRVWRWSQTLHTEAMSHGSSTDIGLDGRLCWALSRSENLEVFLSRSAPQAVMLSAVHAMLGDVLFGWFGSHRKPFLPASVYVSLNGKYYSVTMLDEFGGRCQYEVEWCSSQRRGFVRTRIHDSASLPVTCTRHGDQAVDGHDLRHATSIEIAIGSPGDANASVSLMSQIEIRMVDDVELKHAVELPPADEQPDAVRGTLSGVRVSDKRFNPNEPIVRPWGSEVRSALLSGSHITAEQTGRRSAIPTSTVGGIRLSYWIAVAGSLTSLCIVVLLIRMIKQRSHVT